MLRDAQVVAVGVQEAEVAQTPRSDSQLFFDGPAAASDPVQLALHVIHLQHQLDAGRRAPMATIWAVVRPRSRPQLDVTTLKGHIGSLGG